MNLTKTHADDIGKLPDGEGWTRVTKKYSLWLKNWARQAFRLQDHDLNDLCQETWERVWFRSQWPREPGKPWFECHEERPSFRPYLKLIFTRLVYDRNRKRGKEKIHLTDFASVESAHPCQSIPSDESQAFTKSLGVLEHLLTEPGELQSLLAEAWSEWTEADTRAMKAVHLLVIEGRKKIEIAAEFNCSPATVTRDLNRVVTVLRAIFENVGEE